MSFTPPKPIWVSGGSATAETSIGADGFSSYGGLTGMTEVPESGGYELEWGYKFTMVLEGPSSQVYTNAAAGYYSRGYIYSIPGYIVNNAKITPMRGAKRRVEILWQSIDSYLAPDEWDVKSEDLQPHIERHPMFSSLTVDDYATVRLAFQAATLNGYSTGLNQLNGTSNPPLANLLFSKLLQGMENYYLAGARYTWSSYYLPVGVPSLNAGGSIYSSPGGPSGYVLPGGNSWLRYQDDAGQSNYCPLGGIVKLTRTFIGAPRSFWDADIY